MQLHILNPRKIEGSNCFQTPDLTPWGHWSLHNHFWDKGQHEYIPKTTMTYDKFSKSKASKLADHQPYDLKITLDEGTSPPYGPIYSLSQRTCCSV